MGIIDSLCWFVFSWVNFLGFPGPLLMAFGLRIWRVNLLSSRIIACGWLGSLCLSEHTHVPNFCLSDLQALSHTEVSLIQYRFATFLLNCEALSSQSYCSEFFFMRQATFIHRLIIVNSTIRPCIKISCIKIGPSNGLCGQNKTLFFLYVIVGVVPTT